MSNVILPALSSALERNIPEFIYAPRIIAQLLDCGNSLYTGTYLFFFVIILIHNPYHQLFF